MSEFKVASPSTEMAASWDSSPVWIAALPAWPFLLGARSLRAAPKLSSWVPVPTPCVTFSKALPLLVFQVSLLHFLEVEISGAGLEALAVTQVLRAKERLECSFQSICSSRYTLLRGLVVVTPVVTCASDLHA